MWYVSNVSIISDCPCCYITPFGCLWALFYTFISFFGTNLLTRGPTRIAVFLPILVFRRKGISNGVQTERSLRQHDFLEDYHPGDLESKPEGPRGAQEIGGAPLQGAAPCLVGPSSTSRPTTFAYICLRTLKPSEFKIDREFCRCKPL